MASNMNRRFSKAMTDLKDNNPDTYRTIQIKIETLKTEAATWRRQAQGVTHHGETSQAANDEEQVTQQ